MQAVDELVGQRSGITCVTFDDKKIITGGADNRVLIFGIAAVHQRIHLREQLHKEEEYCVKMNAYNQVMDAKLKKKKPARTPSPDKNMPTKNDKEKQQAQSKPVLPSKTRNVK